MLELRFYSSSADNRGSGDGTLLRDEAGVSMVIILLVVFVVSCAAEIDLLTISESDQNSGETGTKVVKFAKHELAELNEPPANLEELFVLEDKEKVTLVSKISENETMIYTNAGYSLKYNEEDNALVKFEAKDPPETTSETDSLSDKCKSASVEKRYVTSNSKYQIWVEIAKKNKDTNKEEKFWRLVKCDYSNGGWSKIFWTRTSNIFISSADYEEEPPLLLYLKPKIDNDNEAEALTYSKRQLFLWSNLLKAGEDKKSRGAKLIRPDKDNRPQEILPRADAREKQGLLGGMTSTDEGITVWLKNNDGAVIYIYRGDEGEKNVPQFNPMDLELDIDVKDSEKFGKIDKFAMWLPSNKDDTKLADKIEGKVVAVSTKNKLLVAEGQEVTIADD